ncbi:MAG: WD40 repeat domain-containing protein [Rhodopila sp.]
MPLNCQSSDSVAFSFDSTRIVSASWGKTVRIWDVASGNQICVLNDHNAEVFKAAFSPDGTRIVTASSNCTASIWNAISADRICVLNAHEDVVFNATFLPDGSHIITGSRDNTMRIWSAVTGREVARITLDAAVYALSIFGTPIALGDALGRLHVFDAPAC